MRSCFTSLIALLVTALLALAPGDARPENWGASYWAHPAEDSSAAKPADRCDKAPPPFGVGEELVFNVMYGFVRAGTATLAVPEVVEMDGRRAFHLVSRARSSHTFSMFFEVNDKVDSWWDAECLRSVAFEKHLREGEYHKDEAIGFDYDALRARYSDGQEVEISGDVQDMLSSLFCVRTLDLVAGRSAFMESHSDRKNYSLEVRVLGEERVKTPAGTFDCFVVEPMLKGSGIFRHNGRLQVWVTRDAARMPVLMKTKIAVGSIVAELASYRPGSPVGAASGTTGSSPGVHSQARASLPSREAE